MTVDLPCGCPPAEVDPNHHKGERAHTCMHGHLYAITIEAETTGEIGTPMTRQYGVRLVRAAIIESESDELD